MKALPTLQWTGHKDMKRGTLRANAWTCEQLPGVTVRHCGHPTALRPYHVEGGHGPLGTHRLLAIAQVAAELDALCFEVHGTGLADADPDNAVWRAMVWGDSAQQLRELVKRIGSPA